MAGDLFCSSPLSEAGTEGIMGDGDRGTVVTRQFGEVELELSTGMRVRLFYSDSTAGLLVMSMDAVATAVSGLPTPQRHLAASELREVLDYIGSQ